MKVHIGKKIKQIVKESGMTVTGFARKMNYSRRNIYVIFEKESLDTALLEKIGNLLDHDFMQYYIDKDKYVLPEKVQKLEEYNEQVEYLRQQLQIQQKNVEELKKEIEYLKEINKLLRKKS